MGDGVIGCYDRMGNVGKEGDDSRNVLNGGSR